MIDHRQAPAWRFFLRCLLLKVPVGMIAVMAPKELLVLRLLIDNPQGLYGSEIVHLSGGGISRGTVYVLLERLVDKGSVREVEEGPTVALNLKRTRHFITKAGRQACEEFVQANGLAIVPGTFTVS
jgi:DNA-binding PadR family transcriptional regulator